jgi:hypothetical protein
MWTRAMCPFGAEMDTYAQAVTAKRRYQLLEQKRQVVEERLAEGASVAQIALAHGGLLSATAGTTTSDPEAVPN